MSIPDEAAEIMARHMWDSDAAMSQWPCPLWDEAGNTDHAWVQGYREDARELLEQLAPHITERAYNSGHLAGMTGAPNNNPYRRQS